MAMTWTRRTAAALVLGLVLTACGSSGGGGDGASDAPRSTTSTAAGPTTTAATTTTPAAEPSTSSELAPEDDVTRLQFRPVLGIGAPVDGTTTTASSDDGAGDLIVEGADGGPTYTLGPIAFDGTALTSAEAVLNESWMVEVRVTDDSVRAANEAFNACYDAEPTCPALSSSGRGAIGIVLQDELLSAPEVNGLDLASDAFVISGDFDQAEAERIADLING